MSEKGQKTSTYSGTSTTNESVDPTTLARQGQLWTSANALPSTYTPYGGEGVAGINGQQQTGFDQVRQYAQSAQPGIDKAMGMIASYTPQQVTAAQAGYAPTINPTMIGNLGFTPANIGASTVTAQAFPDADLSKYMNPFINNVVNTTANDIDRQRQMAIASGQAQATAAGAFGGSRHGVSDSLTNDAALRQAASTDAALRSAGYTQAQQIISGDQNRKLAADQGNQSAALSAAIADANAKQAAAQLGLTGKMADQRADLDAKTTNATLGSQVGMYNAGQQNTVGVANMNAGLEGAQINNTAARTLGDLAASRQTAGLQGANANYQAGLAQQQTQQKQDDFNYGQWLNQQQFPYQYQSWLSNFTGTPGRTSTTTDNSTRVETGGGGNPFGQALNAAQGIKNFLGGGSGGGNYSPYQLQRAGGVQAPTPGVTPGSTQYPSTGGGGLPQSGGSDIGGWYGDGSFPWDFGNTTSLDRPGGYGGSQMPGGYNPYDPSFFGNPVTWGSSDTSTPQSPGGYRGQNPANQNDPYFIPAFWGI